MGNVLQAGGTLGAANDATSLCVDGMGGAAIQIKGTWVGTITFEGAVDGTFASLNVKASDGTTAVTTATANGLWLAPIAGLTVLQARMSAYTSGRAIISIKATESPFFFSSGSGGSGTPGGVDGDLQYNNAGSFGGYTPGAGIATWLQTPSSANLASAVTGETGTGALVFATSPVLVTPTLGVATATRLGVGVSADATVPLFADKGAGAGVVQKWTNNGTATGFLVIGGTGTIYFGSDASIVDGFGINAGTHSIDFFANNIGSARVTGGILSVSTSLGFSATIAGTIDVFLTRDAANVLAQRNGATAQTKRLYKTFTDAANFERLGFTWASNVARIGVEALGTGTARVLTLDFGGTSTAAVSIPATSGAITFGGQINPVLTTEQLRVSYDVSNYVSHTVSSVGSLTIAPIGTNPSITLTPSGAGVINLSSAANGVSLALIAGNISASVESAINPTFSIYVSSTSGQSHVMRKARNTIAAPRRAKSADVLGGMAVQGAEAVNDSTDATFVSNAGTLRFFATEDFTSTAHGSKITIQTCPIGSTTMATVATLDDTGLALTPKITTYNNVATAAWGVPAIVASGRSAAQTAAVASIATFTPSVDSSFDVAFYLLITTSTTFSFTVQVTYTDTGGTSRTATMSSLVGTTYTNAGGTASYEGIPMSLRAKASTAITVLTAGVFTSVVYDVEAQIRQVA